MIVYHGTTLEIQKPEVIRAEIVGETVSYVMQGIMRREDAVERLRFERINNQLAFCTPAALSALSFVESYEVEV